MPQTLETTRCPDRDTWSGFYAGKADPDSVDGLAAHLDHCRACQHVLDALGQTTADEADVLVAGLRAVSPEADAFEGEAECRQALERVQLLLPGAGELAGGSRTPVPEKLGEYRILQLIGRGGMGSV